MRPYWEGKRVRLRAIEPDDAEHFYHLNMERDVDRSLFMVYPPSSMASQRAWVEKASREGVGGGNSFRFQIEELTSGQLVGSIDTHHLDARVGTFEYGLSVREQYRGHGYAADAILLVLRYYFFEQRFQKANPTVYSFNEASIRLHEKLGFTLEGTRRRSAFSSGAFHDVLMFGMTIEEYSELHSDYREL